MGFKYTKSNDKKELEKENNKIDQYERNNKVKLSIGL